MHPRARACVALAQVWVSVSPRKLSCLPSQLMPASKTKRQPASRRTPFLRGAIYGLFLAGYTYREIPEEITKPDDTNLRQLCLSQKERARDAVAADGGHTKH